MTATAALTTDLQRQVLNLEDDLRRRVDSDARLSEQWRSEHATALQRKRTAASWEAWRDDRVTQAAVAWVLATVFIRFCEDNALVDPVWIGGFGRNEVGLPRRDRKQEALDAQLTYFRHHPEHTDREWLEHAISYLRNLKATAALFDGHAALWWVSPSGQAVTGLLDFWRRRTEDGALVHDLRDDSLSTRFLGDLYQDLSKHAKETYALLQTPEFVEEFILQQTLNKALDERPLDGFRMIDPTCGSGHFLLGAFTTLVDRWHVQAPGLEARTRVQLALDAVHGVDLNPFAVAIARFRLTVAALKECQAVRLEEAPAFVMNLAVGDSLLHGSTQTLMGDSDLSGFTYATEDLSALQTILTSGRYDVVVGNPPYITVKDKSLNAAYRQRYSTCKGKYALTVPFMERFFDLARRPVNGTPAGWVGQITSNSFMKREFGAPLIENLLAKKDLRLVADTSGAYIPGHGTPTVIIVGRSQPPVGDTVRAVLGIRGEPGRPEVPAKGVVWSSIVDHVGDPGWEDSWVSVSDLGRGHLTTHPWSLSGGGSIDLRAHIEGASDRPLRSAIGTIGFAAVTREDDAYMLGGAIRRHSIDPKYSLNMLTGEDIRDWGHADGIQTIWPYNSSSLRSEADGALQRLLWPHRASLRQRIAYGQTQLGRGLAWFEYSMFFEKRHRIRFSLTFAGVATHNHFAFDPEGHLFNRWAPVIKLPEGASEDDHLALLGVLNSSTACFWLKQNSHGKGNGGVNEGFRGDDWEEFYEFTGTTLQDYPLPSRMPLHRGRELDVLAQRLAEKSPAAVCGTGTPTAKALAEAAQRSDAIRAKMIALQEELDWEVYRLYGLVEEDLTYPEQDLPGLALGERAFEIALARAVQAGDETTAWFTRHGSTPITDIPTQWPAPYRELVQRRLDLIASDPNIRLLEKPEYKRRWATEPWEKRQERAVREWLLDRLEDRRFWFDGQGRPQPQSIAQLSDEVARDEDLVSVLALWEGRPDVPVTTSLTRLLADEPVPFLAAYRYKDSGLRKRAAWEHTWALQRREDAGEKLPSPIPVPPKYTSADFRKTTYWQHRGKLDVPKERFILYPDAGRETDAAPLLGWAGWDHAQQALALNLIIAAREADGWDDERLIPLVAGLAELQPWVEQWHAEIDPTYGVSLAAFCGQQLSARSSQVGRTLDELAAWRPATPTRSPRRRS